MEHLGDITALSGYTAMPVDVVIGGSPCQDLSLAARAESNPHPSVWCLQGNAIDRSDTAGCNGKGWKEGVSYHMRRKTPCFSNGDISHALISIKVR